MRTSHVHTITDEWNGQRPQTAVTTTEIGHPVGETSNFHTTCVPAVLRRDVAFVIRWPRADGRWHAVRTPEPLWRMASSSFAFDVPRYVRSEKEDATGKPDSEKAGVVIHASDNVTVFQSLKLFLMELMSLASEHRAWHFHDVLAPGDRDAYSSGASSDCHVDQT
eukprot:2770237-Rhodomonas_salina.1